MNNRQNKINKKNEAKLLLYLSKQEAKQKEKKKAQIKPK